MRAAANRLAGMKTSGRLPLPLGLALKAVLGSMGFRVSLCYQIGFTLLTLVERIASALSSLGVSSKAPGPLPAR